MRPSPGAAPRTDRRERIDADAALGSAAIAAALDDVDRHDDRAALLAAVIVMDLSPPTTLRLALERMGTLLGATTLAIAMAVLVSLVPKLMHVEVVTEKES